MDKVRELAKGRIWSGEEAKKHNLVDFLGGLREAVELAKGYVIQKVCSFQGPCSGDSTGAIGRAGLFARICLLNA